MKTILLFLFLITPANAESPTIGEIINTLVAENIQLKKENDFLWEAIRRSHYSDCIEVHPYPTAPSDEKGDSHWHLREQG